jgi:hypothetical protein
VVSLATSELVRDSDVELFDLSEYRLRDLTGAERVNEARAPGRRGGSRRCGRWTRSRGTSRVS